MDIALVDIAIVVNYFCITLKVVVVPESLHFCPIWKNEASTSIFFTQGKVSLKNEAVLISINSKSVFFALYPVSFISCTAWI